MTEFDRLREIINDRWPYRYSYAEYWEARKRLGLGIGIRTNGEGQRFKGHLILKPEPTPPPKATPQPGIRKTPYAGHDK